MVARALGRVCPDLPFLEVGRDFPRRRVAAGCKRSQAVVEFQPVPVEAGYLRSQAVGSVRSSCHRLDEGGEERGGAGGSHHCLLAFGESACKETRLTSFLRLGGGPISPFAAESGFNAE